MTKRHLRPGDLPGVLPPGGLTLVSSCSAESDLLISEVATAGSALGEMTFSGIFVPGLNKSVWRAGPDSRVLTFFQTPELRHEGFRSQFLPLCYQDIFWLFGQRMPSAALFMCSPPDKNGICSFGAEASFIAALWREIPIRVAHINPLMPRTSGDPGIPFAELTGWFEGAQPLRTLASGQDDISLAIAAHIVPDGATLQTGLGKIPDAVLRALCQHRNLRFHSGLIGDGALELVRSGAMAEGPSAIVGVAIGSAELYAGLDHPHFQFRPVTITHNPAILAGIKKLVTINSAMEVDLYGQIHSEASARGFLSGPGGAGDFARGARASKDGMRIIALPSEAGTFSRIVPAGLGHGPVSLSRFDIDLVVTEHGVADLRFLSHEARAQALISVAAPSHREPLARSWRNSMNTLQET